MLTSMAECLLISTTEPQRAQRKKFMSDSRDPLTEKIIGAAIEVHRAVGPGLLEQIYEECMCRELALQELSFQRQLPVPLKYKGVKLENNLRIDLLVEHKVIIEL